MNRQNPKGNALFSGIGIFISVVFLVGVGVAIWSRGGEIFNPGPVTSKSKPGVTYGNFTSHAEFESQCSYCHQPQNSHQSGLCLKCHTETADQIAGRKGTHGKLENVNDCASCHQEHKGKTFDPVDIALKSFDHNLTRFPLAGKHGKLVCADCHKNGSYDQVQPECVSCHVEPQQHVGLFGTDCAVCHNTNSWLPAAYNGQNFDHNTARFSLVKHVTDRQGQPIECSTCHISVMNASQKTDFDTATCVNCHSKYDPAFMQKHQAQYGSGCVTCHDGKDRLHNFNHADFLPLDGSHAQVACETCHLNNQYFGISADCVACHKEPAIHAGAFGFKCQLCHTTEGWRPAKLIKHSFPPQHGKNNPADCQTCHTSSYAQYTCYGCHDHQLGEITQSHSRAGISKDKLPDCASCHLDGVVHRTPTP